MIVYFSVSLDLLIAFRAIPDNGCGYLGHWVIGFGFFFSLWERGGVGS
jgi:hypothetical protein